MSKEKTTDNFEKRTLEKGLAAGGELHQIAGGEHPALTTNQGIPISDNQNSLKAHPLGPTLLEDFILREKITHFDHERIPERIVHARGTGVHEQAHLASALVFKLSKVDHLHVREAMVGHLRHIDEDLAKRVAKGLALEKMPDPPEAAVTVQELEASPALQLIDKMKDTLMGRSVGILIADGSDGEVILSDEGAKMLSKENAAIDFVRDAFGHLKAIAVDKGGRALLKAANVESDAGIVEAGDKDSFIAAAKNRQWDREKSVRTLA